MDSVSLYTRNVFLVGSSSKGPVNTPVKVTSVEYAKRIFGDSGSLIQATSQMVDMEVSCNLWLVKAFGSHSQVLLNVLDDEGVVLPFAFQIKSKHADNMCNNIKVFVDDNEIAFQLNGYGVGEISYNLSEYDTLQDLASAINEDTKNNLNEVIVTAPSGVSTSCTLAPVNSYHMQLTGGDSGLDYNHNEKFMALAETYSALEGQFVDFILPLECYYDNLVVSSSEDMGYIGNCNDGVSIVNPYSLQYENYYNQLLKFCLAQMQFGFVTHGVMGTSPMAKFKTKTEDTFIGAMERLKELNYVDEELRNYTMLTSVVTSDLWYNYGTTVTNADVVYLSLLASTSVIETSTNLRTSDRFILVDRLSNDSLDKVANLGFIAFRYSPRHHRAVVFNGVTTSYDTKFKNIENVRSFQVVARTIRSFLQEFIGENIEDTYHSGILEERLILVLTDLQTIKLIHSIETVSLTVKDESHLVISLEIIGVDSISSIKLSNQVNLTGGAMR